MLQWENHLRVDCNEQSHTLKLFKIEMYFSAILKHFSQQ